MNAKYRVVIWEYERGWGCKPFMHKDFDNVTEAKAYADAENAKNTSPNSARLLFQGRTACNCRFGTNERY